MKSVFLLLMILFCSALSAEIAFDLKRMGVSFLPRDIASACHAKESELQNGLLLHRQSGCESIEIWAREPIFLPETQDEITITVRGCLAAGHGIRQLILNLKDADGHLVQSWTKPVEMAADEEFVREFKVPVQVWKKRLNGALKLPLQFNSLVIVCDKNMATGDVIWKTLDFCIQGESPSVSFVTASRLKILLSKEEIPKLLLQNNGTEPSVISGKIQILDADGKLFSEMSPMLEVVPNEKTELPLKGDFHRWGFWYIRYNLTTKKGLELRGEIPFAKLQAMERAAEQSFIFGIAGRSGNLGFEPHKIAGINGIRVNGGWDNIQPRQNVWLWEGHDKMFGERAEAGIASIYFVTPPPAWAIAKDYEPYNPVQKDGWPCPDFEAYRTFLHQFATRYRGQVKFYVISNEPDHTHFVNYSEDKYLKQLEIAYKTIKAADPQASIMNGGISSLHSQEPYSTDTQRFHPTIMRRILEEKNLDIFCYHGHGPANLYYQALDQMRKQGIFKKFPWYSGETGISLRDSAAMIEPGKKINPVTIRKKQAEILHEKVTLAKAFGARGYTLWQLWNPPGGMPDDDPENYGVLEDDGTPHPAFAAYTNVIRNLEATQPDKALFEKDFSAYGFKASDGSYLISCWNDNVIQPEQPLFFSGIRGEASKIDLFGNITPLEVKDGIALLIAESEPCFLRFQSQPEAPQVGLLLKAESSSILAGDKSTVELTVYNPLKQAATITLAPKYPAELSGGESVKLRLAPYEKRAVTLPINATKHYISLPQSPQRIRFELDLEGFEKCAFFFPIIGRAVVRNNTVPSVPLFILDRPDQVNSYAISGPEQHLMWRGKEDLSAEVWLSATGEKMKIRTIVQDDIHCQPFSDKMMWKGDSIQVALKLPSQVRAWEFGAGLRPDGKSEIICFSQASKKFDLHKLDVQITRNEAQKQTEYVLTIPFDAIGMTQSDAAKGFRFNLLVNDNDGPKRESSIAIAPTLDSSKNSNLYPVICIR